MRAFCAPEVLDGNNQFYCEQCQAKRDAHKVVRVSCETMFVLCSSCGTGAEFCEWLWCESSMKCQQHSSWDTEREWSVERGYGEGKPPSVLLEGIPEHRQMFQLDVGSFGSKQNFNIF